MKPLALLRLVAIFAFANPQDQLNEFSVDPSSVDARRASPDGAFNPAASAELRGLDGLFQNGPQHAESEIDRLVENSGQRGAASASVPSAAPAGEQNSQTFQIREGNNDNLFFKNQDVAAHAVVTGRGPKPRLVIGFPAGDSGIGVWFKAPGSNESGEAFRAVGPLREPSRGEVEVSIAASVRELTMESPPVLDSIRAIRDRSQGSYEQRSQIIENALQELNEAPPGVKEALNKRGITAAALQEMLSPRIRVLKDGSIEFTRKSLESEKPYRMVITPHEGTVLERTKDGIVIKSIGPGDPKFSVTASVGFDPLTPFASGELLNSAGQRCVKATGGPLQTSLRNLDFLAFKEKFLAGSWQYQTYFGRDTMMTAQMLAPVLSPQAIEASLSSVLDRVSHSGEVAHEEDLADQADITRLDGFDKARQAGKNWKTALRRLDDLDRPIYDYKMIDGDFLLPLLAQEYSRDVPAEESAAFLGRRSEGAGSYADALDRTCRRVVGLARPYATARARGKQGIDLIKHLISLKPGQAVGDWRDSEDGLGGGRFPSSVNVGLVAAAVRACEGKAAKDRQNDLEKIAQAWDHAQEHFMVRLPADEVRRRLLRFLESGGYSAEERRDLEGVGIEGVTVGDFLQQKATPRAIANGVDFMAVALNLDGTPVEVESSDVGLVLYENSLPPAQSGSLSSILSLPFPIGLSTPVGILAANPALSSRPQDYELFDRKKYHGTVIWNWPMQVAQEGLRRQLSGMSQEDPHRTQLQGTLQQLRQDQKAAGGLGNSELYGIKFAHGTIRPAPYDAATESNPVQLWSNLNLRTECGAFIKGAGE